MRAMSRSRWISVIVVLALANYLVFSNLIMLLFTASQEAISHVSATRTLRPTFTAVPTFTAAATIASVPTEAIASTPTPITVTAPTPTSASTPRALTPALASPTRSLSAIPTFAPVGTGTPLKYPFSYTVRPGDTLSGLADRFLVPRAKIMVANGLTDPNLIRVGQVLIIPDPNQ